MKAAIAALERALDAARSIIATDKEHLALNEVSSARLRQHIADSTAKIAELQKAIEMLRAMD